MYKKENDTYNAFKMFLGILDQPDCKHLLVGSNLTVNSDSAKASVTIDLSKMSYSPFVSMLVKALAEN